MGGAGGGGDGWCDLAMLVREGRIYDAALLNASFYSTTINSETGGAGDGQGRREEERSSRVGGAPSLLHIASAAGRQQLTALAALMCHSMCRSEERRPGEDQATERRAEEEDV